jgi:sodium/bile acid cotransporter 7
MAANERTPLAQPPRRSSISKDPTYSTANSCWSQTCWDCSWIPAFYSTNSFLIKAALAICSAKIYPPLGAIYLYPNITATWLAVIFIFTMAGLSLKSSEFTKAATRLRFNIFVLGFNFFVVSLLVFGMTLAIRYTDLVPKGLTDGMIVCSCLPITVSMVIVLTKSAKGDEASSVLLAAVGSLMGVFVSPTLILVYIGVQSAISLSTVFVKLVLRIVVPIFIGQLLQNYSTTVVRVVEEHKRHFKGGQEWALIFIVYTVFCKTFSSPLDATLVEIMVMAICQCVCLLASMLLAWYSLKICFRDEPRLRVMGLYGCTQKSVAMGIPLIGAVYEHDPRAGLFTLPLLIWHPAQLLLGSALAPALADGVDELEGHLSFTTSQRRESLRRSFFMKSDATTSAARRASCVSFEPTADEPSLERDEPDGDANALTEELFLCQE